ncbi:hypothetical protein H0H93_010044, partial [Arthromyces matolae]
EQPTTLTVEAGPRTLRPNSKATLELINLLGLNSQLLLTPRTSPAARNRFLYLPNVKDGLTEIPTSFGAFLKSPLRNILLNAVLTEPLKTPNRKMANDIPLDESLDSFLSRRFGPGVARVFGSALCHGVYAADSRELSVRAAFPSLHDLEEKGSGRVVWGIIKEMLNAGARKQTEDDRPYDMGDVEELMRGVAVYSFRGGMRTLTDALAKDLAIQKNVELNFGEGVSGIEMCDDEDSSLTVHTPNRTLKATHIVSALPLPTLDAILPSPDSFVRHLPHLTANPSSSVTVLSIIFNAPPEKIHPPGFGYLIPRPFEGYPAPTDIPTPLGILGTVFDSCALPFGSPSESEYTKLTVMLGGPYPSSNLSDDELVTHVLEHLTKALGRSLPSPVVTRLWHHAHCIPTLRVGHLQRMSELRQVLEDREGRGAWRGRLEVIGAGVGGVSVGDCIEAGRRVGARW